MTKIKSLQRVDFPEWLVRKRSFITAIVCFYFGFIGILLLIAIPIVLYSNWREHQAGILESIPNAGVGLIIAFSSILGAVKIWRFDRKGVLWIATVLLLAPINWIWNTPVTGEVVLFFLSLVALAISWFDLDPVGHGA